MDPNKIQAKGPWVLLEVDHWDTEDSAYKEGSLYIPKGTVTERLGTGTGRVVSVGKGLWDEKNKKFQSPGIGPGDKVAYRGFLNEANRITDHHNFCFIHLKDIIGIVEGQQSRMELI